MHADLKWLAENVSEWGGTYNFKHIFLEDGRADYSSVPDDVVLRTFTRAQWQAAREHLGLVTTGTEDEAFDAIAKKEKAFIDSSGYRWRSDITAYEISRSDWSSDVCSSDLHFSFSLFVR